MLFICIGTMLYSVVPYSIASALADRGSVQSTNNNEQDRSFDHDDHTRNFKAWINNEKEQAHIGQPVSQISWQETLNALHQRYSPENLLHIKTDTIEQKRNIVSDYRQTKTLLDKMHQEKNRMSRDKLTQPADMKRLNIMIDDYMKLKDMFENKLHVWQLERSIDQSREKLDRLNQEKKASMIKQEFTAQLMQPDYLHGVH